MSLRLVISPTSSSSLVLSFSPLGKIEVLAVGNGGSPLCVGYGAVGWDPFCADRSVVNRLLSVLWASWTFVPGFLVCRGAGGCVGGGVVDARPGVEGAIGAPALCAACRTGRFTAGTG
jgi:hypothetical protein